MAGDRVAAAGGFIRSVITDGTYKGEPTYDAIRDARPSASPPRIIILTRATSIPDNGASCSGSERERHALRIASTGPIAGQKETGYGFHSLGENAIGRGENAVGQIKARGFGAQIAGVNIAISAAISRSGQ